jgi:glycosyltransferase involved in cell wall biosynthesis
MLGKKILILTSAHLCRNPRVVKEATTLGAAGYDVTVMSISVQERFERMDLELMRGLPFKRVTIDYTADNSRARLADFYQRGATWAARQLCSRLGIETAQALGPATALLRFARTFPADLTIVHTEIPTWITQGLIADGRRVAVDMEDWYSEDLLPTDRSSRPIKLLRGAEEFALRHAAHASATAQSMASALTGAYQCPPPIVIRNTFPLQPHSRVDAPATTGAPGFIWFSQTIGPGRGLELFLDAWARTTKPSQVQLLGDERPGYRQELLARLPAARRRDLQFIPSVTPEQLPLKLAEFDIGLALEARTPPSRDVTITNKILQYLNAGLAIVATATAGQREVMQAAPDCGLLVTAPEPGEYAAMLDALLGDHVRLRAAQLAARAAAVREFCWERDAPKLLAAVARALAAPAPSST